MMISQAIDPMWAGNEPRSRPVKTPSGAGMKAIAFPCEAAVDDPPEVVAETILDLARRPEFRGYGPQPGTQAADEGAGLTKAVLGRRNPTTSPREDRHAP